MLVYGDHSDRAAPSQQAELVNRTLAAAQSMAGIQRHAALVSALVDAGRLLQGLADADFVAQQHDRRTPASEELSRFLLQLGHAVCRSWDRGFDDRSGLPCLQISDRWPAEIELRQPEGYAYYAVYPEAYIKAARRLKLRGSARVIGLRSIGTSLAAVVAAALDAPPAVTLRPFGDPHARMVAIDADLESELLAADVHYLIVDEGPGQSGSSFGAVADWLQERGIALERIALVPSHNGLPGGAATEERRNWWPEVQREVGDFEGGWPKLVGRWCEAVLGPLDRPPEEISGGRWRERLYADEARWPAVVPAWERRKFILAAAGERFFVKFAGVGSTGKEKLALARELHEERLVVEPVALVHGYLIERWCEDVQPLSHGEVPAAEIARYIGTRARLFPAMRSSGASILQLIEMTRRNVSLEFGGSFAARIEAFADVAADLERRVVRVRTDNKLDRHEWLRASCGALIKTDAIDHHQAHDLIGCQDVAWDVAGAMAEFDLAPCDAEALCAAVEEDAGRIVDAQLLEFYRIAYLAFRLGQMRLGATMVSKPDEQRRVQGAGDGYAADLQHLLECSSAATQLESSVG